MIVLADRTVGNYLRRLRASEAILSRIDSLVLRSPTDVSRHQWNVPIFWTHNLHSNSLLAFDAPLEDIRRFQRQLESRVQGDVDMSTIDWIWGQYATLTAAGERYQHYRDWMRADMECEDRNGEYEAFRASRISSKGGR